MVKRKKNYGHLDTSSYPLAGSRDLALQPPHGSLHLAYLLLQVVDLFQDPLVLIHSDTTRGKETLGYRLLPLFLDGLCQQVLEHVLDFFSLV